MSSCFDTVPERDRQTDGQTDGRTELLYQYNALLSWHVTKREVSWALSIKSIPQIQFTSWVSNTHRMWTLFKNELRWVHSNLAGNVDQTVWGWPSPHTCHNVLMHDHHSSWYLKQTWASFSTSTYTKLIFINGTKRSTARLFNAKKRLISECLCSFIDGTHRWLVPFFPAL